MKTSDFSYVDPKQQTEHDKKTNRIIYFLNYPETLSVRNKLQSFKRRTKGF